MSPETPKSGATHARRPQKKLAATVSRSSRRRSQRTAQVAVAAAAAIAAAGPMEASTETPGNVVSITQTAPSFDHSSYDVQTMTTQRAGSANEMGEYMTPREIIPIDHIPSLCRSGKIDLGPDTKVSTFFFDALPGAREEDAPACFLIEKEGRGYKANLFTEDLIPKGSKVLRRITKS